MISFGKLAVGSSMYTRGSLNLPGTSVRPHGEARAHTDEESGQMTNFDHFYSTCRLTTADMRNRKRQAHRYIHSRVYEIYLGIKRGKGGLRFGAFKVVSADKLMSGDSIMRVLSRPRMCQLLTAALELSTCQRDATWVPLYVQCGLSTSCINVLLVATKYKGFGTEHVYD